jgi:hypothetical protein
VDRGANLVNRQIILEINIFFLLKSNILIPKYGAGDDNTSRIEILGCRID